MERTRKIVNTKRAITQKVDEPELWFMCSARRLMVFNVCVKFHENMSSGFKVMERTRKLLTDTHTQRKDENIIPPMAYFVCRGYKNGHNPLNMLHPGNKKYHKMLLLFIHPKNYYKTCEFNSLQKKKKNKYST